MKANGVLVSIGSLYLTDGSSNFYFDKKTKKNKIADLLALKSNYDYRIIYELYKINIRVPLPAKLLKKNIKSASNHSKRVALYSERKILRAFVFSDFYVDPNAIKLNEESILHLPITNKVDFCSNNICLGLKNRIDGSLIELKHSFSAGNLSIFANLDSSLEKESRWDFCLIKRGKDGKVLSVNNLKFIANEKIENYESLFRDVVDIGLGKIAVFYFTEGSASLAVWITDEIRYQDVIKIAEGKTIYRDTLNDPVDDRLVFFESFFGKNISGNPKYIYEELKNTFGDKYKYVWSSIEGGKLSGVTTVEKGTKEYFEYLARAKFWVGNVVFPVHNKREETVYLQTWHGTPLKRLGFDINLTGPEVDARESFYKESRNWDYLISPNSYSTGIFKRAFKFHKEILEFGYPQNDLLVENDPLIATQIKAKLGIAQDKKIILYAPTWRDDEAVSAWKYKFGLKIDLDSFRERFSDDYVFLIRMHHLISEGLGLSENSDFVIDVSSYDDVQELSLISDILITDYSSIFYDYANLKRPIIFFSYDLEKYSSDLRGFYVDVNTELPGPIVKDSDELENAILNIDDIHKNYSERYQAFYSKYCALNDGFVSKRIVEKIFNDGI